MMPEPAFLVDGVMEQRILQVLCPQKCVQRLNCNGRDVALSAIVKRIEVLVRLMGNKYWPIIILIDREDRVLSCAEISQEISNQLDQIGFKGQYILGVVDRCIENWILADWENVCTKFGFKISIEPSLREGTQGKSVLKRVLPKEFLYNEPTWGKEFFLSCRAEKIFAASSSFREFVDRLELPCSWLAPISDRFQVTYGQTVLSVGGMS